MPVPWCVHSPVDAQLHCFQVLAGIKKAAINIRVQVFVWSHAFISLGQYMGGEWVTVGASFIICATVELFSKQSAHFILPSAVCESRNCSLANTW